jgi:branched-chain amino acid transport system ATP-binding protein
MGTKPQEHAMTGQLLRQRRATGTTVLIAEQNMHFCLGLASHATVIDKGQIVYTSPSKS